MIIRICRNINRAPDAIRDANAIIKLWVVLIIIAHSMGTFLFEPKVGVSPLRRRGRGERKDTRLKDLA